jgi:hypothetical protein
MSPGTFVGDARNARAGQDGVSTQDMKAFPILLVVLTAFAVIWYVIYQRRRRPEPSKSEKTVAYGWLVFAPCSSALSRW